MKGRLSALLSFVLLFVAAGIARVDGQWPQYRGPEGNGTSASANLPLTWSEGQNVRWKTPVHGRAWSSPVILDRQVWMTTATPDGRELFAIALDQETGKVLHDLKLFTVEKPQFAHPFNTYASPSPVIEPGRVYVTFGSPGTAAIDTKTGKVIWERRDLECNHFRGAGSSPILFRNLLIMHFDGSDVQYVVALDKTTGKTVWRTPRSVDFKDLGPDGKPAADGDFRKAFATPQIITVSGEPLLVSLGGRATYGYDPMTGKERWRIEERGSHSASTRPVFGHGMVFYPTGFDKSQLFAIRPDGTGDATATHIVWKFGRSVPQKPSILLVDDLIYMINDVGIATAVEAKTGELVWQSRVGGTFSASPLYANGRIYVFDEDGKTTVLQAGREFKLLAENQLDNGFMASPAVAGNALFLRTSTDVYRIEEK
ncbi:MAG: PQQ-binding-like beta-propeller repeat protein [Burkholderiales bacterium]